MQWLAEQMCYVLSYKKREEEEEEKARFAYSCCCCCCCCITYVDTCRSRVGCSRAVRPDRCKCRASPGTRWCPRMLPSRRSDSRRCTSSNRWRPRPCMWHTPHRNRCSWTSPACCRNIAWHRTACSCTRRRLFLRWVYFRLKSILFFPPI